MRWLTFRFWVAVAELLIVIGTGFVVLLSCFAPIVCGILLITGNQSIALGIYMILLQLVIWLLIFGRKS